MRQSAKIALQRPMFEHLCISLLNPPEIPMYLMLPTLNGQLMLYPSDFEEKIRYLPLPDPLPPANPAKAEAEQPLTLSAVAGK